MFKYTAINYLTRTKISMMILYGIKNCNTVKAAIDWLKKNDIEFEFHDFKSKGITSEKLSAWCKQVGWEALVNKKGTTWRQLEEKVKAQVTTEPAAIKLMIEKTSVIKRPVIERKEKVITLGFDESAYTKLFQ
jgi:arsenate reductase